MEGPTTINHKGKTINYVDYSKLSGLPRAEQKERTLELLRTATEILKKYPPKSLLSLINLTGLYFDMEIVNAFKHSTSIAEQYHKKMAIVGIAGIMKPAYNFVIGLGSNDLIHAFSTEQEAKEWLASD